MKNPLLIRLARKNDAAGMLEIYGPIVEKTATSFETEIPSLIEFQERIESYGSKSPWLVAETDGKVVGYAYATDHRSRRSYQWNQEVTVYVHHDFRKQGIARKLYLLLLDILQAMNYCKAIAVITLPNDASIGFHRSLGFRHIGEMRNIGYKLGKWHATSWWDLDLHNGTETPKNIRPLADVVSQFDL